MLYQRDLSGNLHSWDSPPHARQHMSVLSPQFGLAQIVRGGILAIAIRLHEGEADHALPPAKHNHDARVTANGTERRCGRH